MATSIFQVAALSDGPFPTLDPFLFCVYHKDRYPAGSGPSMEAPRRGNGHDFNPSAPYRMYHGDKIPGFPQHPHRGFETITAIIEGLIDHADSLGNAGRYGGGDVQWMTAGAGVVHSEMFPLINTDKLNHNRFFQIWLNLPRKKKMVKPSFAMFWADDVPKWTSDDRLAAVTVWAGNYFGKGGVQNAPPPDSWAADLTNDVAVMHITIKPGGRLDIPPANEYGVNRSLFLIEGYEGVQVDGTTIKQKSVLTLDSSKPVILSLPSICKEPSEFLLLQGKPIGEPVVQHGPFVMNTQSEIQKAFMDYQRTQFGGWPWERDDMVFPQDKGKFALLYGKETTPRNECSDTG